MINLKRLFVLGLAVGALFALPTHSYEAVDYDLVRESLQTLHDHTDLPEMIRECATTRAYRHWDAGLYVAISQNCNGWEKTIIIDVLTSTPSYERVNTKDIAFYPSMS